MSNIVYDLPKFLLLMLFDYLRGRDEKNYHGLPFGSRLEAYAIRRYVWTSCPTLSFTSSLCRFQSPDLTYRSLEVMPISFTRFITDIGLPESVLQSKRYSPFAKRLFQPVAEDGFRGVWVVRGGFRTPASTAATSGGSRVADIDPGLDPRNSDVVIYYLHGGGYYTNSPATYLTFLLSLARVIERSGRSVSIFALDYDLAPEARFPTQLIQARRGYEWLTRRMEDGGAGCQSEKVLLMGDSAGGHLCLSLLVDLWRPLEFDERGHTRDPSTTGFRNCGQDLRPGLGVVLISPWLSPFHQPDSFTRNALTDVLSKDFLNATAKRFLPSEYGTGIPSETAPWLDFLDEKTGIDWSRVLPDWIWVCGGKDEILYDDIVTWYRRREDDCSSSSGFDGKARDRLDGEMDRKEPHIYPILKTMDQACTKKSCAMSMTEGQEIAEFNAIERIGEAVVRRQEGCIASNC